MLSVPSLPWIGYRTAAQIAAINAASPATLYAPGTRLTLSDTAAAGMGYTLVGSSFVVDGGGKSGVFAWRAFTQAMSSAIQAYNSNAGGISRTLRSRHYSNARFRKVRARFQTWAPLIVGGVMVDTIHPCALNFQEGFESGYTNSVSGIPARSLFTFNGSDTANYVVITGAAISQNSAALTCTNILGTLNVGMPVFSGTTLVGYVQSVSGTTGVTLANNYTGAAISATKMHSHNGADPVAAYIYSDVLDLGAFYTPGTLTAPNFFGLHTTVESPTQTIIVGGTIASGTNAFTCTSVAGPFDVGSPIFNGVNLIGVVQTVVAAGTSYTLAANSSFTVSNQTCYGQGLPYQRNSSNFLQKYIGEYASTTTAATSSATASASTTVTLAGTSTNWAAGQLFVAAGVPNGTYVVTLGTSTGGNGTIIVSAPVTLAGVAATGIRSNITLDSARSQDTYTPSSAVQTGTTGYFTCCELVIETDSTVPFVMGIGNSIEYGSNEGTSGSGTYGDSLGSPLGNSGWFERGVYEGIGGMAYNLSRGSDGNKFLYQPANWQFRQQHLRACNATSGMPANIHNDISANYNTATPGWVGNTAYAKWAVSSSGGNAYLAIKGGIAGLAGSSGPSGSANATTYGAPIIDGTVTWLYIGPNVTTTNSRGMATCFSYMANVISQIKALVPGIPLIGMLPTPDAASTDNWATPGNQTPTANGWGPAFATSTRGQVYTQMLLPAMQKALGLNGLVDPSAYLEYQGSGVSNIWNANGVAFGINSDQTHPNSYGYSLAMAAVTPGLFA